MFQDSPCIAYFIIYFISFNQFFFIKLIKNGNDCHSKYGHIPTYLRAIFKVTIYIQIAKTLKLHIQVCMHVHILRLCYGDTCTFPSFFFQTILFQLYTLHSCYTIHEVYVIVELVLSSRLLTSEIRRKCLGKTAENVDESSTVRKKPTVQEYQNKTELNLQYLNKPYIVLPFQQVKMTVQRVRHTIVLDVNCCE